MSCFVSRAITANSRASMRKNELRYSKDQKNCNNRIAQKQKRSRFSTIDKDTELERF